MEPLRKYTEFRSTLRVGYWVLTDLQHLDVQILLPRLGHKIYYFKITLYLHGRCLEMNTYVITVLPNLVRSKLMY